MAEEDCGLKEGDIEKRIKKLLEELEGSRSEAPEKEPDQPIKARQLTMPYSPEEFRYLQSQGMSESFFTIFLLKHRKSIWLF